MVLSVWSSPPTVCPPVRRRSAPTLSLFPHSAGQPAADSLPAGWGRCQDTHRRTDAHAYLHVRATAHTLTHSHKSNAWPSSLPSQHALWLPGCCPASIRTRFFFSSFQIIWAIDSINATTSTDTSWIRHTCFSFGVFFFFFTFSRKISYFHENIGQLPTSVFCI